jgi:hypothetical protein
MRREAVTGDDDKSLTLTPSRPNRTASPPDCARRRGLHTSICGCRRHCCWGTVNLGDVDTGATYLFA